MKIAFNLTTVEADAFSDCATDKRPEAIADLGNGYGVVSRHGCNGKPNGYATYEDFCNEVSQRLPHIHTWFVISCHVINDMLTSTGVWFEAVNRKDETISINFEDDCDTMFVTIK